MGRYKDYNYDQTKLILVSYGKQILPGNFEYSLSYLIDNELDLSAFDQHHHHGDNGRSDCDPKLLLKVVILTYSKGIISSRRIEHLCCENIIFMALSADMRPDHSTFADLISRSPEAITGLFGQIVLMCDQLRMIGKEMFAINGCKLPSCASKDWSNSHAELNKKCRKIDRAIWCMLQCHREQNMAEQQLKIHEWECEQTRKLWAASKRIKHFIDTMEDRIGVSDLVMKSNILDNKSAKMKTSHEVTQSHIGVAAVDSAHQIVVHAEAFGQGQEYSLLKPAFEGMRTALKENDGKTRRVLQKTKITADAGYHSRKTLDDLGMEKVNAYIANTGYRSRNSKFKDYKEPAPRNRRKDKVHFTQNKFLIDRDKQTCRYQAGNALWLKAKCTRIGQRLFLQFQDHEKGGVACILKKRCLRNEHQRTPRQINVVLATATEHKAGVIKRMKRKINSQEGRHIYNQRLGTVEPVFGHN